MVRRTMLLVSILGITTLTSACSGPSNAASTASPSPTPNLGATYERLVAPANAAIDQLASAATAPNPNLGTIKVAVQGVIDTTVTFNSGLLTLEGQAPPNLRPDFEAARHADSQEIADLQSVESATTMADASIALTTYSNDASSFAATFVQLRSDLGLPPPPVIQGSPTPAPA